MEDLEKELARREAIALNLADQLNEKIDECEKRKATEVDLAVQLSAKIDECERQKKVVEIMSKRIHDYEEEVKWYVERALELEKQLHEEA